CYVVMNSAAPTLPWLFFSLRGRIARKSYLFSVFFLLLPQLIVILQLVRQEDDSGGLAFWFLVLVGVILCTLWSLAALAVKRLHDLGVTGWLALLILFPTINWIFLLALAVLPTVQETNEHGPPPFPDS
ncbi:MAG: DUF805 domain-containing protein, partial [Rhizobiaceae bacterium]